MNYFHQKGDVMFNSKDTLFGKRDENTLRENKTPGTPLRSPAIAGRTDITTPAPVPVADTTTPVTTSPAPAGSKLIVGPDIKLRGVEITDCDTLVVEGRLEASMDSRVVQIAENGVFTGTVSMDVAEIFGRFDGELTARKQLVIHASGRVSGHIRYGSIRIEEGGELSGDVSTISGAKA